MTTPLRVLLVEDSIDDATLLQRELRRGGYDATCERVETAADMRAALQRQSWDIIICDHALPRFSSTAALALLKEVGSDVPFIVVSGAIGEETAVAMMKAGAHDYIMKNNLTRLPPAIARELREAEMRRMRAEAERDREKLVLELQAALARIKALSGLLPICASCKKIRDDHGYWNKLEVYISEHSDAEFTHGLCPECMEKLYPELHKEKP